MKVIIPIVFEYPAEDWANEYGVTQGEALVDFTTHLHRAVEDGGIITTLDENWPMMRGHITAHTLDSLDPNTRDQMYNDLLQARDADLDQDLITEITEHVAEHFQDVDDDRVPRWILFTTCDWDNGTFLGGCTAVIYFEDGHNVPIDFDGTNVDDLLTDRYGACGVGAALGVDLHAATLEFDNYGGDVLSSLGIPPTA